MSNAKDSQNTVKRMDLAPQYLSTFLRCEVGWSPPRFPHRQKKWQLLISFDVSSRIANGLQMHDYHWWQSISLDLRVWQLRQCHWRRGWSCSEGINRQLKSGKRHHAGVKSKFVIWGGKGWWWWWWCMMVMFCFVLLFCPLGFFLQTPDYYILHLGPRCSSILAFLFIPAAMYTEISCLVLILYYWVLNDQSIWTCPPGLRGKRRYKRADLDSDCRVWSCFICSAI